MFFVKTYPVSGCSPPWWWRSAHAHYAFDAWTTTSALLREVRLHLLYLVQNNINMSCFPNIFSIYFSTCKVIKITNVKSVWILTYLSSRTKLYQDAALKLLFCTPDVTIVRKGTAVRKLVMPKHSVCPQQMQIVKSLKCNVQQTCGGTKIRVW